MTIAEPNLYSGKTRSILALARRNLRRYIGRPAPATYLWREWLEQNSIDRIVAVMTAKIQKATELRHASPLQAPLP
jgi:hypothetical protein